MSVTCNEIQDTYSARDIAAMARILNLAGPEEVCSVVDGLESAAKAAITSSSQGIRNRGREIATFLRYVRDNPPLFVAVNKGGLQNLQDQFTEQGADVEHAFWYGLLIGPSMSQGYSFPSGVIRLPEDLGAHESTLREFWSWHFRFDDQQTLRIQLERRTPNAPFSWLPDVPNSRSVYKLLVSDAQGNNNGAPSVAGGNGLVQLDSQPFSVTVGQAFVLTSVDATQFQWTMRIRQPGFEVDLSCQGSSAEFVRTGMEDLGHFGLTANGTVNGSATNGTGIFQHGWTSLENEDGFQVGYFNRAIHVFPNRSNPGNGIQSRATWVIELGNNGTLLLEVRYLYDLAKWYNARATFILNSIQRDVPVRFRVTDAANSKLTTTPYGTMVTIEAGDKLWSLTGSTSGVVETDNLFWQSASFWEVRAQNTPWAGSFLLDDFQVTRDFLPGWWIETSRQDATRLRQAVQNVCAVDNGGNTDLFNWPRPSAGQATAVFFLFLSPFLLVGLLLFAILFGLKVGKSKNARET